LKRKDLSDIEEAQSIIRLKELLKVSENKLAERLGKSVSYIKQKMQIMNYPQKLLNALSEQLITFSAARELVKITDENVLNEYVGHAVRSGITPAIAKQWADDWLQSKRPIKEEYEEAESGGGEHNFEEVLMPCHFCSKPVKASESRMIRACVPCLTELGK
jgi:ParB family chromosome partitioning protein